MEREFEVMEEHEDFDDETEELREDANTSEVLHRKFASICYANGKFGGCIYDELSEELSILRDLDESRPDFLLVKSFLIETEPTDLIISGKIDPILLNILMNSFDSNSSELEDNEEDTITRFIESFDETSSTDSLHRSIGHSNAKAFKNTANHKISTTHPKTNGTDEYTFGITTTTSKMEPIEEAIPDTTGTNMTTTTRSGTMSTKWNILKGIKLHLVTNYLFSFESAKFKILNLNLPEISSFKTSEQRQIYMTSLIDFTQTNSVRSVGALLRFLNTNVPEIGGLVNYNNNNNNINNNNNNIMTRETPISKMTYFQLEQLVDIDQNTFDSLKIFNREIHPGSFNLLTREGFSLYNLFNKCVSKVGQTYMKRLFLRPLRNKSELESRLNVIEFFTSNQNIDLLVSLQYNLKNVKNISNALLKMKYGYSKINDWKKLYSTLVSAIHIKELVNANFDHNSIFFKISVTFTNDLVDLTNMITRIIDFDTSQGNMFQVNYGVDDYLDSLKDFYSNLTLILNEKYKTEIDQFKCLLPGCEPRYVPQLGFFLSVPLSTCSTVFDYDILEFRFISDDYIYYKNPFTKHLDQEFGDMFIDILDLQTQVMSNLEEVVLKKSKLIHQVIDCCAELDCFIAMALTSVQHNYTRPHLNDTGTLEIINGRHPLNELTVTTYVANHTFSGGGHKKVKIMTGPNACGKSVYLKQVSLITYLAHIGTFVPADSAIVPIIDKIFCHVVTSESLSKGLSTFLMDINQMSNALLRSSHNSLVVIDEFGTGTHPIDGVVLLCSCLNHWLTRSTPHLFVSTHYHSIFSLLPPSHLTDIQCQTFRIISQDNQIVYLYELIDGTNTTNTIASVLALSAGVFTSVIDRAQKVIINMKTSGTLFPIIQNSDHLSQDTSKTSHSFITYGSRAINTLNNINNTSTEQETLSVITSIVSKLAEINQNK